MIPGRINHHVGVRGIMGHAGKFTPGGRSPLKVESHTVLSFRGAFHTTLGHWSGTLNSNDISILTGTSFPCEPTWQGPLYKYNWNNSYNIHNNI